MPGDAVRGGAMSGDAAGAAPPPGEAGSVAIVGGGVIGLLTAVECARAGARVTLVDRGEIPSPRATSYDRHRVVRALHRGSAALTQAAANAGAAWQQAVPGAWHGTGALTAVPAGEAQSTVDWLALLGVRAETVGSAELAARWPTVRFPAGLAGVYEPAAGTVLADRALGTLANWLRRQPNVELHPQRRAVAVSSGKVEFVAGSALSADSVIVAAGPWSRELVPAEDLTLYRQSMLAYDPGAARSAWAGVPAIPRLGTPEGAWLMPPVAGRPVRLSAASACRPVAELAGRETPARWRAHLTALFADLLAGFDNTAVLGAKDAYYLSAAGPDGGPLLADLGAGCWAYAACGGMSFKFAPAIAAALADRALGRTPRPTGIDPIDRPREGSR